MNTFASIPAAATIVPSPRLLVQVIHHGEDDEVEAGEAADWPEVEVAVVARLKARPRRRARTRPGYALDRPRKAGRLAPSDQRPGGVVRGVVRSGAARTPPGFVLGFVLPTIEVAVLHADCRARARTRAQ